MPILKKQLSASGANGTFTGTVELRVGTIHRTVAVKDRSGKKVMKSFDFSKAVGIYEGKEMFESVEVIGAERLKAEAERVEKCLFRYLDGLANSKHDQKNISSFKDLGYE